MGSRDDEIARIAAVLRKRGMIADKTALDDHIPDAEWERADSLASAVGLYDAGLRISDDAERARTVVLADALRAFSEVVSKHGLADLLNEKHPAYLDFRDAISPLLRAVLPVDRVGVDHDTDIDGAHWNGCPGCAADRVGVEPLDVAWKAAEAALPEGWALAGLYLRRKEGFWRGRAYRIGSSHPFGHSYQVTDADVRVGDGATPAAALQALATRLIESPTEGETP